MIQIKQLIFKYIRRDIDGNEVGSETALDGINLQINEGEFVAILGKNGSGKSTFAKQLNAILRPSDGRVLVDGLDSIDDANKYKIRRKAGMVFQNPDNQMVASVVCEDVAFGPENLGLESDEINNRVDGALKSVRMWNQSDVATGRLSGGQKQRVAIAGVLAMEPDYIILDEPTAMLDPEGRKEVIDTVVRLNKEKNMTVVLITHNIEEAINADRVIVIENGRVCADDTPDKIFMDKELIDKNGITVPFEYRVWREISGGRKATVKNIEQLADKIADIAGDRVEHAGCRTELARHRVQTVAEPYSDNKCTGTHNISVDDEPLLVLKDVSYVYNPNTAYEKTAVKDISAAFKRGEFVGIAGHTGSGKSTLIQLFNGLLSPTNGCVMYEGRDINSKEISKKYVRSKIGMVFQYPEHQMVKDTVYEDVIFGPRNLNLDKEQCEKRAKASLSMVGIPEEMWDKSPLQLSGGQKRRVAIAGVLAMKPDFIILDEPAAGLDAEGKREIFDWLRKTCVDDNIGIILVSHSMEDIAEYTDRMIVLNDGGLIYDDIPATVFSHSEELRKMGLDVPCAVRLMNELSLRGFPGCPDIVKEKDAIDKIRMWTGLGGNEND